MIRSNFPMNEHLFARVRWGKTQADRAPVSERHAIRKRAREAAKYANVAAREASAKRGNRDQKSGRRV